jgi:hypothetical protein
MAHSWAYQKEYKSGYNRDICTLLFITALSTIAKLWNHPRCHIYIHIMEFYSATRKNDAMWFEDKWMQLEYIMLSEVS